VVARRERASLFCARGALDALACGRSSSPLDAMDAPLQRLQAEIFADYFQFYLWDANAPHAPVEWTDRDVANRIKVAPNVVVICPARNMSVPVVWELHHQAPGYTLDDWDHVVECTLDCPSGHLAMEECTGGTAASMKVAPGTYRVRAYYGGLATLSADGLDGDDHYLVALWPAASAPLAVLKQWRDD
jgi:hypothetical protein